MQRFLLICFLFGILTVQLCLSGGYNVYKEYDDDSKKSYDDTDGESMKYDGGWGDGMKEKSERVKESMKEFSDQAKYKFESGIGAMKSFGEGIGDHFTKAKQRMEEHGEKMKEAHDKADDKFKDEFETAGSKISKDMKDASEHFFSMFRF